MYLKYIAILEEKVIILLNKNYTNINTHRKIYIHTQRKNIHNYYVQIESLHVFQKAEVGSLKIIIIKTYT